MENETVNLSVEEEVNQRLNLKMMLFSDPGMGKTTTIASSYDDPRIAPILWIDVERSQSAINSKVAPYTLEDLKNNRPPIKGKISYLKISEKSELQKIVSFLAARSSSKNEVKTPELKAYLQSKDFKPYLGFRTIVIDNLTEVSRIYLQDSVLVGNKSPDGIIPTLQDYNRRGIAIGDVVRMFRDLNTHTIFTAHAFTKENEIKEETIYPSLGGLGLSKELPGLFQVVGYIKVNPKDDNTREIIFQPTTGIIGVKCNLEESEAKKSQVFEKNERVLSKLFDLWHIVK